MNDRIEFLKSKIKDLKEIEKELELKFNRKFTLDGHLIGSLTEIYVKEKYGLELIKNQSKKYVDAYHKGKEVQIKGTQFEKGVNIKAKTDILLVYKIDEKGNFEEIYNGSGKFVWDTKETKNKNNSKTFRVSKLRQLNKKTKNEI